MLIQHVEPLDVLRGIKPQEDPSGSHWNVMTYQGETKLEECEQKAGLKTCGDVCWLIQLRCAAFNLFQHFSWEKSG